MSNDVQGSVALDPPQEVSRPRQPPARNWIDCIPGLLKATDVGCILLAGMTALALHLDGSQDITSRHVAVVILMASLGHVVLRWGGVYTFERIARWPARMGQATVGLAAVGALLIGTTAMLDLADHLPYRVLGPMTLYSILGVVAARAGISALIRRGARAGSLYRRIAIVGTAAQADQLVRRLETDARPWQRLVGLYTDGQSEQAAIETSGASALPGDLAQAIRRNEIDDVVVALPTRADARLNTTIQALRDFPVRVLVVSVADAT